MTDTRLSRLGFRDPKRAEANLVAFGDEADSVAERISHVADADTALNSLCLIAEAMGADRLFSTLADEGLRERLFIILGTSRALGEFLARHPEALSELGTSAFSPSRVPLADKRAFLEAALDANDLRVRYYTALLGVVARDLDAFEKMPAVMAELSDLAVATLGAALKLARSAEPNAHLARLAIIAMGKTGGHELNYVSDVDVIFVAEPAVGIEEGSDEHSRAIQIATRLAQATMRLCSDLTPEGSIWEVDANLRPEGADGPLVRSVASHVAYYERWASTWEFQALLKARYGAGDEELAGRYLDAVRPMIWESSTRAGFVRDMRAMRTRVIEHIPADERDRQLKLGSGGLRDVEFAVQMLQLVHGRVDESVRSPTTLTALDQLRSGGYIGRLDGALLEDAYEFLRTLEHRIQLFGLKRTHLVPQDPEALRRLGRSMGFATNSADSLVREWHAHRRVVGRLHEKLFYRPLLDAVAQLPEDSLRLTSQAAKERLSALGFVDPDAALAHIQALTSGVSRRASIQQSLLPAMLSWFAESPAPDQGLLAFRTISEELGNSHWYLRTLRDEGAGAEQLAKLLSSSAYVSDLIVRAPDIVAFLGDDAQLVPHDLDRLWREMELAGGRHKIPHGAVRAIRRVRRRELARIAMADVLHQVDIVQVGEALTAINTAALRATLTVAEKAWLEEHDTLPTRMAIVLMGRLGGYEAGYSSDADVMFVHEPVDGADEQEATECAMWLAQLLSKSLGVAGSDPALQIDAELRPEGKNGPLVRTLESYAAYYERWSDTWEAQALLRAAPVVGDPQVCRRFAELIDPLRYPDDGLSSAEVLEIRRIKARVESERLPRGADPTTHLKLGRGGLADIEWTAQLLQMQHARELPGLRTTRTIEALQAAAAAGLMSDADADALICAWMLVSRIRNGVVLMRNKPAESMVEDPHDRAQLAHLLGYGQDHTQEMVEEYLRVTRHAHQVVDRVFWE